MDWPIFGSGPHVLEWGVGIRSPGMRLPVGFSWGVGRAAAWSLFGLLAETDGPLRRPAVRGAPGGRPNAGLDPSGRRTAWAKPFWLCLPCTDRQPKEGNAVQGGGRPASRAGVQISVGQRPSHLGRHPVFRERGRLSRCCDAGPPVQRMGGPLPCGGTCALYRLAGSRGRASVFGFRGE